MRKSSLTILLPNGGGAAAHQGVKISTKSNINDLVTEADQKVEKFFIESVKNEFPSHKILGEENSSENAKNFPVAPESLSEFSEKSAGNSPVSIVDPIDGTMNFVHGMPYWCCSIGFVAEGKIIFGVIYQATTGNLYHGYVNKGSYVENDGKTTKLQSSNQKTIKGSLQNGSIKPHYFSLCKLTLSLEIHGIRCPGACALQCCDMAMGATDFYSHIGIHAWDYTAGILIAKEAGCVIYDATFKSECDIFARSFGIAATDELAVELKEKVGDEFIVRDGQGRPKDNERDVLAWAE